MGKGINIFDKGLINENYNEKNLNKLYPIDDYKNSLEYIYSKITVNDGDYLEIVNDFSPAFSYLNDKFKSGTVITEKQFESMLIYHISRLKARDISVYHHKFSINNLSELGFEEKFDFIYSYNGINYSDLFEKISCFISFLKIDGIMAIIIPSFWFKRDDLNDFEKVIIDFAKKNDKKWVFTEPIDTIIADSGAELISIENINLKKSFSRLKISELCSLTKLYNACVDNNIAILETCSIPEDNLLINLSLILIRKKGKTLTKDNLFNF